MEGARGGESRAGEGPSRAPSRDYALATALTVAVAGIICLGIFSGFILSAQDVAARTLVR